MILVFSLLNPGFSSAINISSVLKTLAFYGIVAIGETLIMFCGDIDISVGSTAGFGAVFGTYLMTATNCLGMQGTPQEGVGVILCMAITMAFCSIFGFVNAFLIVNLKLSSFIATIATLYSIRGLVMVVTKGNPIYPLPSFFINQIGSFEIKIGSIGLSLSFIIFVILGIAFFLILQKTTFGRNLYATGSNQQVAKLSGINTNKIRYIAIIITAMLASFSGMLVAAFTQQGYPPIGQGWELYIVAAIVIGGVSLTGGAGSVFGTMLGMVIMNVMNNGLVMLNINTFAQQAVLGIVILLAVFVDVQRRSRKVRQ
jgi:ribose transport system permease protein